MRHLYTLLMILIVPIAVYSQSTATDWTTLKEEKGIKISYKYADCDFSNAPDAQWILLRFESTYAQDVLVEYSQFKWYNGVCGLCQDDPNSEARKEVKIPANSKREGYCDAECDRALRVFVKFTEFQTPDILTKFEIEGIVVTVLEN